MKHTEHSDPQVDLRSPIYQNGVRSGKGWMLLQTDLQKRWPAPILSGNEILRE